MIKRDWNFDLPLNLTSHNSYFGFTLDSKLLKTISPNSICREINRSVFWNINYKVIKYGRRKIRTNKVQRAFWYIWSRLTVLDHLIHVIFKEWIFIIPSRNLLLRFAVPLLLTFFIVHHSFLIIGIFTLFTCCITMQIPLAPSITQFSSLMNCIELYFAIRGVHRQRYFPWNVNI